MAGNVSAWGVAPVLNPSLRGPKGQRLFRMAQEQSAGRSGPVRQTRRRDEVVSPLAFERECAKLMHRAISIARDATTARVLSMELLAAEALTLPEAHRRAP
jgi:hypothetical protein